jgi:putative tricarboxylic transport membrane protein
VRTADIVCAVVILIIGVVVIADSIRVGIGWGVDGPAPGFFPCLMGAGVVIGCVIIIARAVQRKGTAKSDKPFLERTAIAPVLLVVVPAAAMVLLTHFIGIYIAAAIYMIFSMRVIGKHGWPIVLALSVLIPVGFYYLFDKVFLIPMPRGSVLAALGL